MNILIVYDLAMNRAIIERTLRMDGHNTIGVSRIEDPKRMLVSKNKIDAVVCDLIRPETDGIRIYEEYLVLLKSVPSKKSLKPVPFILLTAPQTEKTAVKTAGRYKYAKDIGFYDIISKPVDHDRLRSCLTSIEEEEKPKEGVDPLRFLHKSLDGAAVELLKKRDKAGADMLVKLIETWVFKLRALK